MRAPAAFFLSFFKSIFSIIYCSSLLSCNADAPQKASSTMGGPTCTCFPSLTHLNICEILYPSDALDLHLECDDVWIDCCASCTLNQCSRVLIHSVEHVALYLSLSYSDESQKHWMTVTRTRPFPSYTDTLINSPLRRLFLWYIYCSVTSLYFYSKLFFFLIKTGSKDILGSNFYFFFF